MFDVASIFLNALMAAHGDIQLAAIGIVEKVERVPNAINIGICQGMLPLVAYNDSSGDHKRVNDTIHYARKMIGLLICFACMILFQIFAGFFVTLFLDTSADTSGTAASTITFAAVFLRIRSLASLVPFLNYNSSYCIQGLGDGRDTMAHAIARELVFYIPFIFLLNHFYGELACALIAGEGCGTILATYLLRHFLKEHASI